MCLMKLQYGGYETHELFCPSFLLSKFNAESDTANMDNSLCEMIGR
jgi:hypothetical protein